MKGGRRVSEKKEMVRNSGSGQIMEEGDSPGFFKILRSEDLSSEIIVSFSHFISEFSFLLGLSLKHQNLYRVFHVQIGFQK